MRGSEAFFRSSKPLIIPFLMLLKKYITFVIVVAFLLGGCKDDEPAATDLKLLQVFSGSTELATDGSSTDNIALDQPLTLMFSLPLDRVSAQQSISLKKGSEAVSISLNFSSQDKSVAIYPSGLLESSTVYTIAISDQLKGVGGGAFPGGEISFETEGANLELVSLKIGGMPLTGNDRITGAPLDLEIEIEFSLPINTASMEGKNILSGPSEPELNYAFSGDNKTVTVTASSSLEYLSKYTLSLPNTIESTEGETFAGLTRDFYTALNEEPKFPVIPDEDLLTKVQQQTFRYFWDFAHPVSGLARERNTSGDIVTVGGSGFGVMAILVGIERGFITREEGVDRLSKIVDFLESADRFHGVWPHWLNGQTGDAVPFSAKDNGGDLVETAFMIQGLLTVRAYLAGNVAEEAGLIDKITALWEEVEWSWYTRDGQNVLYWHWSPEFSWEMNHPIRGYNEALIVYVLAAASPTYPISKEVYVNGWAQNGSMVNGNSYYGTTLPLGYAYGGPLFFAHYSFLGLDPRQLSDQYANYWEQNVNHSLINQAYCAANPRDYAAYSEDCWGITASDNHQGYSAHSPTNDLGVITPTAALSSFPYTPEESMKALKFFYYGMGNRLWGEYGFYDAFNVTEGWVADSYLAIDQGPIVVMIENHRSGLLWDLFMTDEDVQEGLSILEFSY